MHLIDVMGALDGATLLRGDADTAITRIDLDSRSVTEGSLFCCIVGSSDDGHLHAEDAVKRGAVAILTERDIPLSAPTHVAEIRVPRGTARAACARLSAEIVGRPADELTMVGVTGTNGKTTVATILGTLLEAGGFASTVIGTLTGARTTPAPPELHRLLAEAERDAEQRHRPGAVAMEVSSHALDQERVSGIHFAVGVFTNLSHDHLDYHGTMDAYLAAKARLFEPEVAGTAVIWAETPEGASILERCGERGVAVGWGSITDLSMDATGSRFVWRSVPVAIHLLGRLNVINTLLAAEAAVALGMAPEQVAAALASIAPIEGRMEIIPGPGSAPLVVVDYAHTPEALESALEGARLVAGSAGSVTVVFGCGGDRDVAKRPKMGAVASGRADKVFVTTDNPRHEDPAAIASSILSGVVPGAVIVEEADRARAIGRAIRGSRAGDVVLIAGKGHETTQVFADATLPFNDREIAASVLASADEQGDPAC